MAITVTGSPVSIPYPVEGNEVFWENFLSSYDGSGVNIVGATAAISAPAQTGKMFSINGFNALAGTTFTLPAATGSGTRLMFYVNTLATSLSHILQTNPLTDFFIGIISGMNNSTGAQVAFAAASTSNTITLNRAGTGSVTKGEWIEVIDVAAGLWLVRGMLSASGAAFTTPFSHV